MKLNLDAAQIDALVAEEFGRWSQATCADGRSAFFTAQSRGQVQCDQVEFNCERDNVNVVMFQDQDWPHSSSELALTTVSMDQTTGQIFDADVEVNTDQYRFRLDSPPVGTVTTWDLRMVLAHELGHFLGLSHSNDSLALMAQRGKVTPDLTLDDVAGVCAIYPPREDQLACPKPRSAEGAACHGEKRSCPADDEESGCTCMLPQAHGSWRAWILGLLVLAVSRRWLAGSRAALRVDSSG